MKREPGAIEILALLMGDEDNAERARLPFGIDAQRIDGQMEMMREDILPRDLRPSAGCFVQAGFRLGKLCRGIFVEALLPEGWTKRATPDYAYLDIVDATDRSRGTIYFNAAFFERSAYAALLSRYRIRSCDLPSDAGKCEIVVWDFAADVAIKKFGTARCSDTEAIDRLQKEAKAWIDTQFPENMNPSSYW